MSHGHSPEHTSRRRFLTGSLVLGATGAVAAGSLAAASGAYADVPDDPTGTVKRAASSAAGDAAERADFWVAPAGDDAGTGERTSPFATLTRAQRAVREATAAGATTLTVHLGGGTYELAEPLLFTSRDAGPGRQVAYVAVDGETPVLSGGSAVTGWRLYDAAKNIWRAAVGPRTDTRQLWVNGRRAVRARSAFLPAGFEMTETGYVYSGEEFDFTRWRQLRDVELVSFRRWRSYRCRIESAERTGTGVRLDMQNPGWELAYADHLPWGNITVPVWVENAYELLDEEGEWYLDTRAGHLYYKPRAEEDLASAETVLGRLETLLEIRGELDDPVMDLRFDGISFCYGTWLEPNSPTGFAVIQAGYHQTAPGTTAKLPANVTMRAAERVAFHRCRFQHLGGSGLELEYGTRHADITGNLFEDVSGNGIQVSGTDEIHHHPDDDRATVLDNRITNNCVTNVASEYHGCVGIWVGYADTTTIEHNTVYDLPYTAISVGWGWGTVDPGGSAGYTTPSTSRNNSVSYNHIHHFTQRLIDGGGIYTLSAQPGSVIRGNYIHDLVINHYDDSLVYLDEATRNYLVEDNVLCGTPSWWLKIWTSSIRDNRAVHNFVDRPDAVWNDGVDNVVEDNVPLDPAALPEEAQAIAARAGVEPAYRDLLPGGVPAPPPVSEVCDPDYAGQPPLGPPWTP
ncbi:right-handed parallel beta-helix repeat-containing protein [Actinopolymorpha pittospori]|uniref:Right handed beta helix region n=1 Tax=Actinopolymorpha pittospori TaxID=648752 RepID=A0A927MUJ2_9ACTN|nr:hypothetical protein [Actinopolymorpha pittospori]